MSDQGDVKTAGPSGDVQNNGASAPVPAARRQATPKRSARAFRKWLPLIVVGAIAAGVIGYFAWQILKPPKLPPGFASSNGRIEATEIDIATKIPGRIKDELVDEGNFVAKGDVLSHIDVDSLEAQRREAVAKLKMAESAVDAAKSTQDQRKAEKDAALAVVAQDEANLNSSSRKFARDQALILSGGVAQELAEADQATFLSAKAALSNARASVASADAAIATAKAMVIAAVATVAASQATIERIDSDIHDSTLKAPRSGRVQYRVAQPGEVLPAGGKVMNMLDLNDVYMTFFLPTDWAGRVKVGAETHIVLDALPQVVIPAKVTFVADVAQFTPKTVETAEERQKLTFRIKAHIPPELLKKYVHDVKTGLPGVAYVQLDPQAQWPAHLQVNLPE